MVVHGWSRSVIWYGCVCDYVIEMFSCGGIGSCDIIEISDLRGESRRRTDIRERHENWRGGGGEVDVYPYVYCR